MLAIFHTTTFLSVWYWMFTAFFWSLIVNWTFGVSKWALDRAKESPEDQALAAQLCRRSLARAARMAQNPPLLAWAFQAFLIGAVATLAVLRGSEIAQGLLFMAAPMAAFSFWRMGEARRLSDSALDDAALLKRIAEIRFYKQVLGTVNLSAAALYGMWLHQGEIIWNLSG